MIIIKNKIIMLVLWLSLVIASLTAMALAKQFSFPICATIAGALFSLSISKSYRAAEDVSDTSSWQVSLRKNLRGKLINKDTCIRISFAYLFRIKVGNKYLLIKNSRGTDKYQPIGGVYKYYDDERIFLANGFHIVDDNKIPVDSKSQFDYRLQLPCKYLKRFVKRFDNKESNRERINNLSREFIEEIGCYISWDKIKYRYCGRYYSDVEYSKHFKCYQFQLFDIVELLPSEAQLLDLEKLISEKNNNFKLVSAEDIEGLGIVIGTKKLKENIADHTVNILQEKEQYLFQNKGCGEVYEVNL